MCDDRKFRSNKSRPPCFIVVAYFACLTLFFGLPVKVAIGSADRVKFSLEIQAGLQKGNLADRTEYFKYLQSATLRTPPKATGIRIYVRV